MNARTIAALLALGCAACAADPGEPGPNVLMICIDTLRADHLGCYGYDRRDTSPALDRLAASSTLFRDTTATACWTKPSVPSFLTGTFPLRHGVYDGSTDDGRGLRSDVLPERAETLAERFQAAGYQTGAFVKNAHLRKGQGLDQGFEHYEDRAGDAREIRWKAVDWLEERAGEKPFFLYLHFLDVHWPYPVPDEYAARYTSAASVESFRSEGWRSFRDDVNEGRRTLELEDREALVALYDGALRFVDDQIGRLLARMEDMGIAQDTIVCVISDHGEEFFEHGRIGHGHGLYEGLLHVPWILYVPGRKARVVDTPCSLVDVHATLVGASGLGIANDTEGVDRTQYPDVRAPVFAEHLEPGSYSQSCRSDSEKLVRRFEHRPGGPRDGEAPLVAGGRYEARVRVQDGALVAERLRPSDADEDELEVKGVLAAAPGGGYALLGLLVDLSAETELYGETTDGEGRPRALAPGLLVKVKATLEGRVLKARRVKLYAADEEVEVEVRGYLAVLGEGRVVLDGVELLTDDDTEIERADPGDMTREDVVTLLNSYLEGGEPKPDERVRFDLASDPQELNAIIPAAVHPAERALDEFTLSRLPLRLWTRSDTSRLTPEEAASLRAIGY